MSYSELELVKEVKATDRAGHSNFKLWNVASYSCCSVRLCTKNILSYAATTKKYDAKFHDLKLVRKEAFIVRPKANWVGLICNNRRRLLKRGFQPTQRTHVRSVRNVTKWRHYWIGQLQPPTTTAYAAGTLRSS